MVSKVVYDICYFILPLHLKATWPLENGQQYPVKCGCHTLVLHDCALEGVIVPFHARVMAWSIVGMSHSCHRPGYSCSRHRRNPKVACKNITFSFLAQALFFISYELPHQTTGLTKSDFSSAVPHWPAKGGCHEADKSSQLKSWIPGMVFVQSGTGS